MFRLCLVLLLLLGVASAACGRSDDAADATPPDPQASDAGNGESRPGDGDATPPGPEPGEATTLVAVVIDHASPMQAALEDGSPQWGSAILAVAESLASVNAATHRVALHLAPGGEADPAPDEVFGFDEELPEAAVLLGELIDRPPAGPSALLGGLRRVLEDVAAYRAERAPDAGVRLVVLAAGEESSERAAQLRREAAAAWKAFGEGASAHVFALTPEDRAAAWAWEAGAELYRPEDADALRSMVRDVITAGEVSLASTDDPPVETPEQIPLDFEGVFLPSGRYDLYAGRELVPGARILHSRKDATYLVLADRFEFAVLIQPRTRCLARVELAALQDSEDDGIRLVKEAVACSLGSFRLAGGGVQFPIGETAYQLLPRPPLVGRHPRETVLAHSPEYARGARYYAPDPARVEEIRDAAGNVSIVIYFGTWCAYCNRYMPHGVRLEELVADAGVEFTYLGLPAPPAWMVSADAMRAGVTKLPTGIVTVGGA